MEAMIIQGKKGLQVNPIPSETPDPQNPVHRVLTRKPSEFQILSNLENFWVRMYPSADQSPALSAGDKVRVVSVAHRGNEYAFVRCDVIRSASQRKSDSEIARSAEIAHASSVKEVIRDLRSARTSQQVIDVLTDMPAEKMANMLRDYSHSARNHITPQLICATIKMCQLANVENSRRSDLHCHNAATLLSDLIEGIDHRKLAARAVNELIGMINNFK